ncbi:hypothetical protein Poli38472_000859 [Pythium oligandrum]|uniref:Uncharacterized protein n=1 Tax=Pythium oligandrum TaxID=41045 RepID=A0A8K1CCP9_PYTOL|nr:hypothetical protein Poli38472_000859 [Pythium oligandrum]|eukprot:TMW60817.1 hypothetical protein Poli38472_000859 [Pythium oligandrum]
MIDVDEWAGLFRTLVTLDADVHLRYRLVRAQCEELESIQRYMKQVRTARLQAQDAAQRRTEEAKEEAGIMQASLEEAIQRARRIRQEIAEKPTVKGKKNGKETDESDDLSTPRGLQDILAKARSIRAAEANNSATKASSEAVVVVTPIRLEYPRRMKTLMEKLEDLEAAEREQSFRFVFCKRLNAHLAMRQRPSNSETVSFSQSELAAVQVSFPKQVQRLTKAYNRLRGFLIERVNAEVVENAFRTQSLTALFPLYCRIKQAKKMLKTLNEEANALARRIPPRPRLSEAAIAHREKMLRRLRKKEPTSSDNPRAQRTDMYLLKSRIGRDLEAHSETLAKLNQAWESQQGSASEPTAHYSNAVQHTILVQSSNILLQTFQRAFSGSPPDPSSPEFCEIMMLLRFVDSVVLHRGQKQRSVVSR